MVLKGAFSHKPEGAGKDYFWEHEVDVARNAHGQIMGGTLKANGTPLDYELTTMSKSKNNGVDPQALIESMGADTARLFVMFASPPEQTLEWNDAGVEGAHRFVKRVWAFGAKHADRVKTAGPVVQAELSAEAKALRREVFVVLKQISFDYERMQYNTVASGTMKLLNALEAHKGTTPQDMAVLREGYGILLRTLYPACPHLTHVLWESLGYATLPVNGQVWGDLLDAPWPAAVAEALVQDEIELMLQINGKLRGSIKVSPTADKAAIEAAALASDEFIKFSEGQAPKKVVVVPGRLVNVVV
jgi:leucyl-tRNA synthetase